MHSLALRITIAICGSSGSKYCARSNVWYCRCHVFLLWNHLFPSEMKSWSLHEIRFKNNSWRISNSKCTLNSVSISVLVSFDLDVNCIVTIDLQNFTFLRCKDKMLPILNSKKNIDTLDCLRKSQIFQLYHQRIPKLSLPPPSCQWYRDLLHTSHPKSNC